MTRARASFPHPDAPSAVAGAPTDDPQPEAASGGVEPEDAAARFLRWDRVDEWGAQSFPASDPPANW